MTLEEYKKKRSALISTSSNSKLDEYKLKREAALHPRPIVEEASPELQKALMQSLTAGLPKADMLNSTGSALYKGFNSLGQGLVMGGAMVGEGYQKLGKAMGMNVTPDLVQKTYNGLAPVREALNQSETKFNNLQGSQDYGMYRDVVSTAPMIAGFAGGGGITGLSAAGMVGQNTGEGLDRGMTSDQSQLRGVEHGALDAASMALLAGGGKLVGGISKLAPRVGAYLGLQAGQGFATDSIKQATDIGQFGIQKDYDLGRAGYSALLNTITGGLLEGVKGASHAIPKAKEVYTKMRNKQPVTPEEMAIAHEEVYNIISKPIEQMTDVELSLKKVYEDNKFLLPAPKEVINTKMLGRDSIELNGKVKENPASEYGVIDSKVQSIQAKQETLKRLNNDYMELNSVRNMITTPESIRNNPNLQKYLLKYVDQNTIDLLLSNKVLNQQYVTDVIRNPLQKISLEMKQKINNIRSTNPELIQNNQENQLPSLPKLPKQQVEQQTKTVFISDLYGNTEQVNKIQAEKQNLLRLPELVKSTNSPDPLQPTLPKLQAQTLGKQAKVDLNANGGVTEPIVQNKPISYEKITKTDITKLKTEKELINHLNEIENLAKQTTDEKLKFNLQFFTEKVKAKITNNRQFIENSVLNSKIVPDEVKQNIIKNGIPDYDPITNKGTFDNAMKKVNTDMQKATNEYYNADIRNADTTALAEAIAKKSYENGDIEGGTNVLTHLAERLTTAGQEVQAAAIMKKLTPEGMVMHGIKTVNKANENLKHENPEQYDKLMKNKELPELSQEDVKYIYDKMTESQKQTDTEAGQREKSYLIAEASQRIADKLETSFGKKLRAYQLISMLSSAKSIGTRPLIGNSLNATLEGVNSVNYGMLDKLASHYTKERSTTGADMSNIPEYAKGFIKGIKDLHEDIKRGVDTSRGIQAGGEIRHNTHVFKNKALNTANNFVMNVLRYSDRPFAEAMSAVRQHEFSKLEKQGTLAKSINKEADITETGKASVFQTDGIISKGMSGGKQYINKALAEKGLGSKDFGAADLLLPLTKTGSNLLGRAFEYTPMQTLASLISFKKMVKTKTGQTEWVRKAGRSMTGTGLIGLGAIMMGQGLITGSGSEYNETELKYLKDRGWQPYSFKIGDTYSSFDWLQPAAVPLIIGAELASKGKKSGQYDVGNATATALNTLLTQSYFRNIEQMFGYGKPVEGIYDTFVNSPSQFIPNGLGQIANMTDSKERDVSAYPNAMLNKIPLLKQTLPVKVDSYGQERQSNYNQNPLEKLYNVAVNPSNISKSRNNEVDKEIQRLIETQDGSEFIPKLNIPKFSDGKKNNIVLNPQQKQDFQKSMGQAVLPKLQLKINSEGYKSAKDENKAKMLGSIVTREYEREKKKLILTLPKLPLKK